MSVTTLTLGYSPFNCPTGANTIRPFDAIFDYGINLMGQESLAGVDAVILWGGNDISPALYNQPPIKWSTGPEEPTQRDLFEWEILREASRLGKPIIGVCRGAQMICAFTGGKLAQNIKGHETNHRLLTYTGETLWVSSSHHQMMVPKEGTNYEEMAWPVSNLSTVYEGLTDEETEAYITGKLSELEVVYFPDINAMAIQCHPEWHKADDMFNKWIMQEIIEKQFNGVCV